MPSSQHSFSSLGDNDSSLESENIFDQVGMLDSSSSASLESPLSPIPEPAPILPLQRTASLMTGTTSSSFSTVWGPGAWTGKALKAFGKGIKNAILVIAVNGWLASQTTLLNDRARFESLTDEALNTMRMELAELTREYWGTSIRINSLQLISKLLITYESPTDRFRTLQLLVGYGLFKDSYGSLDESTAFRFDDSVTASIYRCLPDPEACRLLVEHLQMWMRTSNVICPELTWYLGTTESTFPFRLYSTGIVSVFQKGLKDNPRNGVFLLSLLLKKGYLDDERIKSTLPRLLSVISVEQGVEAERTAEILARILLNSTTKNLVNELMEHQSGLFIWKWVFNHRSQTESDIITLGLSRILRLPQIRNQIMPIATQSSELLINELDQVEYDVFQNADFTSLPSACSLLLLLPDFTTDIPLLLSKIGTAHNALQYTIAALGSCLKDPFFQEGRLLIATTALANISRQKWSRIALENTRAYSLLQQVEQIPRDNHRQQLNLAQAEARIALSYCATWPP